MTIHSIQIEALQLSVIQLVSLIGFVVIADLLLTKFAPLLPAGISQIGALMILPIAAGLAYWMAFSFGGTNELGLTRPDNWLKTLATGVGAGLGVLVAARFIINPLAIKLFGPWLDPEMFAPLKGQLPQLFINVILISWLHAALCEEIIFRGFILRWVERLAGGGQGALALAIIVQAILFGLSHYPQGRTGILTTTLGGLLWGGIFLAGGRQLWVVIVGHATVDTVLFTLAYFGQTRLFLGDAKPETI
ncbi:MAG TPA: CPBP family intramembrane glutamic endopeptidase [Anaerolineales bacterium]|nr:CPBP family intramembrane glutamic endopeptidase [Anaerolineales bacterium]